MRLFNTFPIFPEQASTMAPRVDALYLTLIAIALFFGVLISGLIVYFAVKYHRRTPDQTGAPIHSDLTIETIWTVVPLLICLGVFAWSSRLFVDMAVAPRDAIQIYGVGKQWMWELQHVNGSREMNTLHVPVHRTVRLILTSQDVIHDFFVPAFRMKADVLPGRYTTVWFEATQEGHFHLFCAEYCGTHHSGMIGEVVVMSKADYETWLRSGAELPLASQGEHVFHELACDSCHQAGASDRGPTLMNLFNSSVRLANGERVTADETYLRQSILQPQAQIVEGYQPSMPSFQGVATEEQLRALIEYIRSRKTGGPGDGN